MGLMPNDWKELSDLRKALKPLDMFGNVVLLSLLHLMNW